MRAELCMHVPAFDSQPAQGMALTALASLLTTHVDCVLLSQFTFSDQTWVPANDGLGGAALPVPALGFGRPGHTDQVRMGFAKLFLHPSNTDCAAWPTTCGDRVKSCLCRGLNPACLPGHCWTCCKPWPAPAATATEVQI